jgi:hypothetical protein
MGRNPAHPGASPAHPPFTLSCVWPSSQPIGPAGSLLCFLSARPSIAEPRPIRPVFAKPSGGPPKLVLSSPAGSLLHRRKFSPTVFFTRILRILTKSRTNLRLEIDTASATCVLWWGPTTLINRRRISSNFQPQAPTAAPPPVGILGHGDTPVSSRMSHRHYWATKTGQPNLRSKLLLSPRSTRIMSSLPATTIAQGEQKRTHLAIAMP